MNKRIISIIITACMTMSIGGCSQPSRESISTEKNEIGIINSIPEGEIDWWEAYKEPIKISTVTSESASAVYPQGDDVTSNVWTRAYKERFNIELVTDWVSDEYNTKLNLAITSNDLPDVFKVSSVQLQQLIEADMVYDLTEIFDAYASERLKGYMEADKDSFESGKVDGKLYGIAQMHWGIIDQPDYIWIRKDWKEALQLDDPKTMEDVKNICLAFMKEHGGYGIAIDQGLSSLNLMAPGWHAYPDMWIKDDTGQIVYGSVQPEMKNALADWAEWYKEGIISKDFATTDNNAMNEAVVSGKVGVQPYYQWWGYNPGVDTVTNLGAEAIFEPYQIPSVDGKDVYHPIFFANGSYTVVNKKCKNPEAIIKMLNFYGYMVDDAVGVEEQATINEFLDEDRGHVVGALRVLNPNCDYEQNKQVSQALETKDTSKFSTSGMWQKYNNSIDFIENNTSTVLGDYLQQGHEKSAYGLATEIIDDDKYIKSELWGPTPETLLNYGSTLKDILLEGFTKIIMGTEDIDYFEEVIANWKMAGGDEATAAMNEMYGE